MYFLWPVQVVPFGSCMFLFDVFVCSKNEGFGRGCRGVHMSVQIYIYAPLCTYVLLCHALPYCFWERVSRQSQSSPFWIGWLVSKLWDRIYLSPSTMPGFFMVLHVCRAMCSCPPNHLPSPSAFVCHTLQVMSSQSCFWESVFQFPFERLFAPYMPF